LGTAADARSTQAVSHRCDHPGATKGAGATFALGDIPFANRGENIMTRMTALATLFVVSALPMGGAAYAQQPQLNLSFTDAAWTGETVPEGQHCPLQGGTGATPAIHVANVPETTTTIKVAFNDESYQPMNDGGHGIIAFAVTPVEGEVDLPSVPGNSADLPEGATVDTAARGSGEYASPGYLPPCSGGQGNTYSATVTAYDANDAPIAAGKITLGKY
jgi:hypothetical protein